MRKIIRPLTWRMDNKDKGKSDLRIRSKGNDYVEVEVSLPKLLFGTNKKLIHSQAQIEEALAKADKIVEPYAKFVGAPKFFSRVDLVWHFLSSPPEYFFLAHQHSIHPEVRTKVCTYRERHRISGIEWHGGKTMHVKMYNKTDAELPNAQEIVRVEIMLKWDRLKAKLANHKNIHRLKLNECYQSYRSTLLHFHPRKVPIIKGKDLAICHAIAKGVPVLDLIEHTMSNGQLKLLKAKAAKYILDEYKIDWNRLLPKNSLPPKFDAVSKKAPKPRKKFIFRK